MVIVAAHFLQCPLLVKVALSSKHKDSPQNRQRSFPAVVNVRKSSSPVVPAPGVLLGGIVKRLFTKLVSNSDGMRSHTLVSGAEY